MEVKMEVKMEKDNKIINCDVTACKYNDSECKNCALNEIIF